MGVPAAMLAEFQKTNGEFYKRLTVNFPKTTELITLIPDATELDDTNHLPVGAGTIHEALDDPPATPDDGTTHVRQDAAAARAESRVSFPALPSFVVDIEEVRVYCRAKSNANAGAEDDGAWLFAAHVNATNYFGSVKDKLFFNPEFQTMSIIFDKSPDTNAAWTVAEVDAIQVSIISQPDSLGDIFGQQFTQVYVEVKVTRSTTGRYSDVTINSKADGLFEAKVTRWGEVSYSVVGSSNAIQRPKARVSLADTEEDLNTLFAGAGVDEVRRSTATIEYVSPNVPKTSWWTVFTGVLDSWDEVQPHEWDLGFIEDDSSLEGDVPNAKINEIDFPDADPKEYDKFVQFVYGRHISEGLTDDGMVLCPNVDSIKFRRLIAQHIVTSIPKVYSKGNTEDPAIVRIEGTTAGNATTAQYQVITPVIGGKQYTLLEFNLTGASADEKDKFNELTIAADVNGVEDVGDGTGFLITNPATMFKHLFVNHVANEYGSGKWLPDSAAPVDTVIFEETRVLLNLLGQDSSRIIGGTGNAATGRRELNGFCSDLNLRPFWTEDGKLAVLANVPFSLTVYLDDPWFRQGLHDVEMPVFRYDSSDLFDRVLVSHLHQHNGNAFLANVEIRDFEVAEKNAQSFRSFWLPSGQAT